MYQVRIHGRGGQGVVTAAQMLSVAVFLDGRHAQAFPSFGSERMGAPVVAFCRIDDAPIRSHEPVSAPNAVVVCDPTLVHHVDLFAGLDPSGLVLINTSRTLDQLGLGELPERLPTGAWSTLAAGEIARRHIGRPFPNTVLLAALAQLTDVVSLDSVIDAIGRRFAGEQMRANVAAAREAAAVVRSRPELGSHA